GNATGTISNTATVSGNQTDHNPANNSATQQTAVTLITDLAITKTDIPDPVTAGQNLTYTITVTNNGPSAATGVTVCDTIPAQTTYSSNTTSQGTYTVPTWNVGSLAGGASANMTLVVTVSGTATGTITNTATVSGNEADHNQANNSATAETGVIGSTDLAITKSGAATVDAGGLLTYTITVTNNGPSDATGVSVNDTIPAQTTYSSNTTSQGTYTVPTWNVGSLAGGASANMTLVVAVSGNATGTISNTATVSGNQTDPNPGNNSATQQTAVTLITDLAITKTDIPDPVTAGQNLTYTITVTNNGPSTATGVVVSDTIPAQTTYSSNTTSQGTYTVPTWNVGSLASGASANMTLVVTVS
ncbi:MAG: DUF11 domain-containing protein, partial [Dehalococcoidales bacterium]|nr:DUF11 domain-containing protein [Dehalococcoidales bacterium]